MTKSHVKKTLTDKQLKKVAEIMDSWQLPKLGGGGGSIYSWAGDDADCQECYDEGKQGGCPNCNLKS